MPRFTPAWSDERFDTVLAYVLRTGVLLSATVVACGGLVFLARHGFERPAYHVFRGEPIPLRSVHGIVAEGLRLNGRGLIQLGLLLLIATPIARVVFSVAGFIRQRDWVVRGDYAGGVGAARLQPARGGLSVTRAPMVRDGQSAGYPAGVCHLAA